MELENNQLNIPIKFNFEKRLRTNDIYTLLFVLPKKTIFFEVGRIKNRKIFKGARNFKRLKSYPNEIIIQLEKINEKDINTICFSPCNKYLAIAGWESRAKVLNIDPLKKRSEFGKVVLVFGFHTDSIRSIDFSKCGNFLTSGSYDGTSVIYNFSPEDPSKNGLVLHIFRDHISAKIYHVKFSSNSKFLATGSTDKKVYLYDISNINRETSSIEKTMFENKFAVKGLAFSPYNNYIAIVGNSSTCSMFSIREEDFGKNVFTLLSNDILTFSSVCFSPFEDYITFSGGSGKVHMVGINPYLVDEYGKTMRTFGDSYYWINSIAIYAINGIEYIATGGDDATTRIYILKRDKKEQNYQFSKIKFFKENKRAINSIVFSEFGHLLASGSWDNVVTLLY